MSHPLNQVIIFGASGDLTARKLVPALLGSFAQGAFADRPLQIIGVARRAKDADAWRDELAEWLPERLKGHWPAFRSQVHYVQGDSTVPEDVVRLRHTIDELANHADCTPQRAGRLFYLALKPALFGPTVAHLDQAGLLACELGDRAGWRRVVVEKPFGTDLPSAQRLNRQLLEHLREDQILRIDHYLGKETVQNILGFRFQNAIFEPLWSREHVESVEISVCESVGIDGDRGRYYDGAGALRDMVQNHVLQLLSLVAMEPPSSMHAEAVRNEKVKVFEALVPLTPQQVHDDVVRGQYTASDSRELGYRQATGVADDSRTETYVAIRAQVHNWRWNGVPFLLRTGKCLHRRYSEIVLRFRVPPVDLLAGVGAGEVCALRPNALRILIQPTEGIRLGFLVKEPGSASIMRHATLGFDYKDLEGARPSAPAYQRLLLDAIDGNPTLFIRGDEVEAAWRFADAIRAGWDQVDPPVHPYAAGSTGPVAADGLWRGSEGLWGDVE